MFSVSQDSRKVTTIIFDIGGVLNEGSPNFVDAFNKHGITLQEDLWASAQCKELIVKFCTRGYGLDEAAAKTFAREICIQSIGREIDFEKFKAAWNAVIIRLHDEVIDKIDILRSQGYRLFVLSDTNMLHREYLEELYQIKHPDRRFSALFDRCYFSHETGNYKGFPGERADGAWLQILDENKLKAEECLFIDDRVEHVERAQRLGFFGLHYPAGSTSQIVFQKLDVLNSSQKIKIDRKLFASYAKRKDLNKFQAVLNKCEIAYETDVSNARFVAPSGHNVPYKKNAMLQRIFENNSVEINFVSGSDVPFYFLIIPKNQAREDNNFFLLRVESFICNLRANGYAQHVVYQNFGDHTIKIIPLLSEGIKVDINQKIINAILCYFGEEALLAFDTFPIRSPSKMLLTDKRFQSLYFSRKTVWTHVKDLAHNVNKALLSYLLNNRVLLASQESLKALDKAMGVIPDELQKNTASCAFCQENTIRNQLVLDCGKLLLMVNFRPFAGTKAHFLILPKRHIEDWSDLREDERIVLTLVVQSLLQSIQANCGVTEAKIISYVQNGMQAGQTAPHSHMHVMTTPKYIPYLIDIYYQMAGMVAPALTSTKMAEFSDLFKPVLFQSLLFSAPPPRLLKFDIEKDVGVAGTLMMFNAHKDRKDRREDRRGSSETKVDYGSVYPVSPFTT